MYPSHTFRHLMGLGTREATETFRWFFGTKNAPSHSRDALTLAYHLTRARFSVNCAFFYGLFLRGHSPEQLRRDIAVPPQVAAKWSREAERQPELRDLFERMIEYR